MERPDVYFLKIKYRGHVQCNEWDPCQSHGSFESDCHGVFSQRQEKKKRRRAMADDSRGGRAKESHASADDNPFGFLADLLQNLGKFCEPQSETSAVLQPKTVSVDRVKPRTGTEAMISESGSGGCPEKTPRRFLDESPTLPPGDDSAETMTPADMAFVPYVKPGVKIVMPSEAVTLPVVSPSLPPSRSHDHALPDRQATYSCIRADCQDFMSL
jgi:hypothetical protein